MTNRKMTTAARTVQIAAAIRKLGAATIIDLALELDVNRETVRRYMVDAIAAGHAVMIVEAAPHVSAVYGSVDLDDTPEFDQRRVTVTNWPRGQFGRDSMTAALFGAPRPVAAVHS